MRPATLAQSFGLLSIFLVFAVVGQFLFSSFSKEKPASIYRIFPLSSLPLAAKEMRRERTPAESLPQKPKHEVSLHLKNGRKIQGELVRVDERGVTLNVDGSEVGFRHSEIAGLPQPVE